MKPVGFHDFQKVRRMSLNDFNRWVVSIYQAAYAEGLRAGEEEYGDGVVYDENRIRELALSVPGIGGKRAEELVRAFVADWNVRKIDCLQNFGMHCSRN